MNYHGLGETSLVKHLLAELFGGVATRFAAVNTSFTHLGAVSQETRKTAML